MTDAHALADPHCGHCDREHLRIRYHRLFAPRDFDISPYFRIFKPTLERGFDDRRLRWAQDDDVARAEARIGPPANAGARGGSSALDG
ncbi:MAG: hypothetical protein ACOY5V_08420 [Pseudomonadota bacterium]